MDYYLLHVSVLFSLYQNYLTKIQKRLTVFFWINNPRPPSLGDPILHPTAVFSCCLQHSIRQPPVTRCLTECCYTLGPLPVCLPFFIDLVPYLADQIQSQSV